MKFKKYYVKVKIMFRFINYINFKLFIISFIIGLFYVYQSEPEKKIIYVYPTPENINLIQYKDKADNCFSFDSNEVLCPDNKKFIKNIPVQE